MKIECLFDKINEGEDNSKTLELTVDAAYSEYEVRLSFVTPKGNAYVSEAIVSQNGEFLYNIPSTLLDGKGILYAQILIYNGSSFCAKSSIYEFAVLPSLPDGNTVTEGSVISLSSLDNRITELNESKISCPPGGEAGQVLTKTQNGVQWANCLGGSAGDENVIEAVKVNGVAVTPDSDRAVNIVLPDISNKLDSPLGGSAGQVLTKTENGAEWADAIDGSDLVTVHITGDDETALTADLGSAYVYEKQNANIPVIAVYNGKIYNVLGSVTAGDTTAVSYYHISNPGGSPLFAAATILVHSGNAVIVSGEGEYNLINSVKVNGTALNVSGSAVNISVPTKTSDLTNDSEFITALQVADAGGIVDGSITPQKINGIAGNWNLFDQSKIRNNLYLPTDGRYFNGGKCCVLELTAGETYHYTADVLPVGDPFAINFFDADMVRISGGMPGAVGTVKNGYLYFTVPEGTVYTAINLTWNANDMSLSFDIQKGDTTDNDNTVNKLFGFNLTDNAVQQWQLNYDATTCEPNLYNSSLPTTRVNVTNRGLNSQTYPPAMLTDGSGTTVRIPVTGGKFYTINYCAVHAAGAHTVIFGSETEQLDYYFLGSDQIQRTINGVEYALKTIIAPSNATCLWAMTKFNSADSTAELSVCEGTAFDWVPQKSANKINGFDICDSILRKQLMNLPYNKYAKSKVYCFGDSITMFSTSYVSILRSELNCFITNKARSGDTTAHLTHLMTGITTRYAGTYTAPDYTDIDAVTIMIGTNGGVGTSTVADIPAIIGNTVKTIADGGTISYNGATISTVDDYWALFPNTFYGNIALCIEYVQWQNPDCKIYLITPPSGDTLAIRAAMLEIGLYYGVPVIDALANCGINRRNKMIWTTDGTHPNAEAHIKLGKFIAGQMTIL